MFDLVTVIALVVSIFALVVSVRAYVLARRAGEIAAFTARTEVAERIAQQQTKPARQAWGSR